MVAQSGQAPKGEEAGLNNPIVHTQMLASMATFGGGIDRLAANMDSPHRSGAPRRPRSDRVQSIETYHPRGSSALAEH